MLLTREGLASLRAEGLGKGYVEKFPGSRGLRDAEAGVNIDVVIAGVALLPLANLIELKLASGLSAPHRLKDLADVLELVRALSLRKELAANLDASVREKYLELWQAAQVPESE